MVNQQIMLIGAPKRAEQESISSLTAAIERIAGDDELISRIVLSYVEELEDQLVQGQNPSDKFFTNIIRTHWPKYERKSCHSDEMIIDFPEPETSEESKLEQDMMDQYLARIQKVRGKKVKGVELQTLCRTLATKTGRSITKKSLISKPRMLQWIVKNRDSIEPVFDQALNDWTAN